MKDLMTRKIVLGLLMTLVLAFGVQGIANALTLTKGTGDFQNANDDVSFTITFTAGLTNTEDNYYNDEAVTIRVSGANITHIGTTALTTPRSSHTLKEAPHGVGVNALTSAETTIVRCLATSPGKVTITVEDATPGDDLKSTDSRPANLVFTTYVVKDPLAVRVSDTVSLLGVTKGIGYPYDHLNDVQIYRGDGRNNRVTYRTTGTAGTLYIKEGNRAGKFTAAGTDLETSSSAPVYLSLGAKTALGVDERPDTGSTNTVTVSVSDNATAPTTGIYIYRRPQLSDPTEAAGLDAGRAGLLVSNAIMVTVRDGGGQNMGEGAQNVGGVPVTFKVTNTTSQGGLLRYTAGTHRNRKIDANNKVLENPPAAARTLHVRTADNGQAVVDFEFGSAGGEQEITVTAVGITKKVKAVDTATSTRDISIRSEKRSNSNTYDVYATVTDNGREKADVEVTFTAISGGELTSTPTGGEDDPTPADSVEDITNLLGIAQVIYDPQGISGTLQLSVSLPDVGTETMPDTTAKTIRRTFNVRGSASPAPPTGTDTGTGSGTTSGVTPSVSPTSVTGTTSSTHTLTFTAPSNTEIRIGGIPFNQAGGIASPAILNTGSSTTAQTRLTLPDTAGPYTLNVVIGGVTRTFSVTVTQAVQTTGTVRVNILGGGGPGTRATVRVTATDANGNAGTSVTVTLRITAGGGTFLNGTTTTTVTTGTDGTAMAILTRGSTPGNDYYITATPSTGYTFRSTLSQGERLTIDGAPGPGPPRATGEPADLDAYDGDDQVGSLNSPLPEPLVVEVVDANNNPVENVRVRFRTTIGTGRFSPRTVATDEDGLAETIFTPTSAGRIRIVATVAGINRTAAFNVEGGDPADALEKVSGDNQSGTPGEALANPFVVEVQDEDGEPLSGHRVSFSVTEGGGSLSETSAVSGANGRAQTTLTLGSERGVNSVRASVTGTDPVTFSTSIDAKILVAATNRPVMYWIAGGALYRLAGAKEAKIANSANGMAIGDGKVYWTAENPSGSGGTINSANLDGTGVTELASIFAVPMGIAVDTAGSKLYWTNSSGRIQRANLNGSGIQNVLQGLSNPTDIVVSNGFIYWTGDGNSIRRVNISGQQATRPVATNLDTVGGLAVGGGKVYWTEMTSESAGTVNGANLNGTNFETLATLLSAPMGIGVDTTGNMLYWTNARGRVQRANLDGSGIKNVVTGLISATKLVIGGANVAEAVTKQPSQPAKKDTSVYDVNGDGKVDNTDASLVANGFDTGNAKYDVNNDGAVNFLDLLLVFDNRDADAAGAPTVVGMKLSAVQVDILQEQINLLIATGDRSPAAMRTLVYLQQLLATARPEKTQLFANYPNPFNPETWIPYELATDTTVKITIYNTQGVVIRTLALGHQAAGYYTGRDRAAYWDGRNALGEQVASGIYFYQFETDDLSSMRKMVILK